MESLLGTSLEDPRTMAVMSAVQGLLGGRGGVARHLEWSPGLRRHHASGQAAAGSGRTPQAPARPTCLAA